MVPNYYSQEVIVEEELEKQLEEKAKECLRLMRRLDDLHTTFTVRMGRDDLTIELYRYEPSDVYGAWFE